MNTTATAWFHTHVRLAIGAGDLWWGPGTVGDGRCGVGCVFAPYSMSVNTHYNAVNTFWLTPSPGAQTMTQDWFLCPRWVKRNLI